ncbi:hypothetical protein IF650_00480 [Cellulosimicrobium terreum]|nr:hypothetical protein [Cellulosimicrobium terreum]
MKRLLASAAAAALALGGLVVATAAPASAHTPRVTNDCDSLDISLTSYTPGENTVTVVLDGETVTNESFSRGFERSFGYDPNVAHDWSVKVVAHDGNQDNGYNVDTSGRTTPCPTEAPGTEPVQVGVYVYPKLDSDAPASWENSGKQGIVTTLEIERPENPGKKTWVVSPLDLEDLRAVAEELNPEVTTAELCTEWGVQQDLVGAPADEYTLPTVIEKSSNTGIFPDGLLLGDDHQDVGALLPQGACDEPTPPTEEPEDELPLVLPEAPELVDMCGVDNDGVTVPDNTEELTYEVSEDGLLTVRLAAGYAFAPETESEQGYVVAEDGTSATIDLEAAEFTDEDCTLVPGDIEAVCESDVPYLGYAVALPEGVEVDSENPLTITFIAPEGEEDYVVEDQPLSGSILWPGASDAEPQQWPGWEQLEDGSYAETDGNYAWTRAGVEVLFEVNPSYSTIVEYPEATSTCANPPADVATLVVDDEDVAGATPVEPSGPSLASTGATVAGAVGLAVLLIGGGAVVFWLRRRVQA